MKSKTILVVDDSTFDRHLLVKALATRNPKRVLEAASSEECLQLIESEKPDLVLLDVMMPDNEGVELLRTIRKSRSAIDLPIIMVTSKDRTEDLVEFLQNGANDFVTKPINFEVLFSRSTTQLRLLELSRAEVKIEQLEAINAMVTTYNHEINNPLTIAIMQLERMKLEAHPGFDQLHKALWRIAEIVKRIRSLPSNDTIEYDTDSQQRFKYIKLG